MLPSPTAPLCWTTTLCWTAPAAPRCPGPGRRRPGPTGRSRSGPVRGHCRRPGRSRRGPPGGPRTPGGAH
ncbi:hypothetical protein ACFFX0_13815 [Citricoccus parietis]|uniref:Secreted protein n=1 Tax=Citricoccus parietis TaxID=592307 RepID=A0ABV5FZW4_9MICC